MIKRNAIIVNKKGLDLLKASDVLSPESLHRLRVATKRLRCLWKFVEPESGKKKSRKAQRRLRDSAKLLAKERDRKVMLDTLNRFKKGVTTGMTQNSILKVEGVISGQSPYGKRKNSKRMKLLTRAFKKDLKKWKSMEPLLNGISLDRRLAKTYERAYELAGDSWKTGDIKIFHKWRRWTKYLCYQLETLKLDHSPWLKAHFGGLKTIGGKLGIRQDLYTLRRFIKRTESIGKKEKRRLIDLIEAEDAKALRQCRRLSDSLFVLAPDEYRERVKDELGQSSLLELGFH